MAAAARYFGQTRVTRRSLSNGGALATLADNEFFGAAPATQTISPKGFEDDAYGYPIVSLGGAHAQRFGARSVYLDDVFGAPSVTREIQGGSPVTFVI